MKPALLALALVLAPMSAGCVTPPADDTDDDAAPMNAALPFTWGFNATQCDESIILLLLSKAELQTHLPEGFVAGDASVLVDRRFPGAALDRGILFANAFVCEGTDIANDTGIESQVGILVETPQVEGERPAALFEFYELGRITPSSHQRHTFDGVGWAAFGGNVTSEVSGTTGRGVVEQEGEPAWSMSLTLPGSQPIEGIGRFWHAPGGGIGYVDYHVTGTQLIGNVQCEIMDGSLLAQFTSVRSCSPENALGSGLDGVSPPIDVHWLPNATVTT